jgi:hypothetical protein
MLRRLYQKVLALAGSRRAPWALAAVSFAESSFFPIPPDVMLAPRVLARRDRAFVDAAICTAASVAGGILGYAIGYYLEPLGQALRELMGHAEGRYAFQAWFNQGLRLAWAFAHEEATAAFREAVRLDPDCGMCAWGEALSLGPTINYPVKGKQKAEAYRVAVRAQKLLASSPERERRLGSAMVQRYSQGNRAYARAMEAVARDYPDDDSVQVAPVRPQPGRPHGLGTRFVCNRCARRSGAPCRSLGPFSPRARA